MLEFHRSLCAQRVFHFSNDAVQISIGHDCILHRLIGLRRLLGSCVVHSKSDEGETAAVVAISRGAAGATAV